MPVRPKTHKPRTRATQRHQPTEPPERGSTARGYGHRWQKAREAYLAAFPLCAICSQSGFIKQANEVDHIIPHRGDQQLFWDRANWQSLCKSCHSRKTAREDGGFGNRGGGSKV